MRSVRELALDAIDEVSRGGRKPREALDKASAALERRDRAFLMELCYGVIRKRDRLDWVLGHFLKKPGRLRADTLNNLRLGAYQILFMRVPEWAAVHEAVNIEKKNPSLVNAVLRSIVREQEGLEGELRAMQERALAAETPLAERVSLVSTLTSHPKWLLRRWIKRFGYAEAFALAEANDRLPPFTLRVNTLKADRESVLGELNEHGIEAAPTRVSPEGIKLVGTMAFGDLHWLRGKVYVQDEASQLISHILRPEPGQRVLDACAAPGGKTTHIAQLMGDTGEVVAVDRDPERVSVLEENVSMLGIRSVRAVCGDMNTMLDDLHRGGPFDRVLLDAPCSSTGVIRRNPDVKFRHRAADLKDYRVKQLMLLFTASRVLKPGGVLVYCTCSTEPEEGEEVVREFLKTSGDFFNIEEIPLSEDLWSRKFLRTYPHRHDMDGFFAARLRRIR